MMTYRESLTAANTMLAADPNRRFVGYGITHGRAMGTLRDVPEHQLVETPVAENLMVGLAIGMALDGLRPVVFIERFDFILNALDAIVNHLDKIPRLSANEFCPAVILRIVVGNKTKPLFTGLPHTQDFTEALRAMVSFDVFKVSKECDVIPAYEIADVFQKRGESCALIEYKDLM